MCNQQNFSCVGDNRRIGNGFTLTIWSLSGVVLAACGGGGGGSSLPVSRDNPDPPVVRSSFESFVNDGSVQGARVYAIEPDGTRTFIGTTDQFDGVTVSGQHHGKALVVDVEGAIDTTSNRQLSGEWRSLPVNLYDDGRPTLISPLTDLFAETSGHPIFSLISVFGNDVLTIADIVNPDNYNQQSGNTKARLITTASIALTEIARDSRLSNNTDSPDDDTPMEMLENLFRGFRGKRDKSSLENGDLADGTLKDRIIATTATNDTPPEFTSGTSGVPNLVENAVDTGKVLYTARATTDFPGATITYSLIDGVLENDLFRIDPTSGEVTFRNALDADYEHPWATNGTFMIRVRAAAQHDEAGAPFAEQTVSITLANVPDANDVNHTPSITSAPDGIIDATLSQTSVSGRIVATDEDMGDSLTISVSALQGADSRVIIRNGQIMGTLSIEDNTWSFTAHPAALVGLDPGESISRLFYATAFDGTATAYRDFHITLRKSAAGQSPQNDTKQAYENHPIHKAVHDFEGPDGVSGTWSLPESASADNALFRIDDAGKVWWRAFPDFESPADTDRNNIYDVSAVFMADDKSRHEYNLALTINNLEREISQDARLTVGARIVAKRETSIAISYRDLRESDLPSDPLILQLLGGIIWRMPETGPAVLTWSLVLPERNRFSEIDSQADIEQHRKLLTQALTHFEAAANLKFIEIGETDVHTADISFLAHGQSGGISYGATPTAYTQIPRAPHQFDVWLHEIGHTLGLPHPFEVHRSGDLTSHADYYRSDKTIMSYYRGRSLYLQQADIDVLQYLYGAPGTDFDGVQAKALLGRPPIPHEPADIFFDKKVCEDDSQDSTAQGKLAVGSWENSITGYEARPEGGDNAEYTQGDNSAKGAAINGIYGVFYLKSDGTWIYEIDNARAETDALDFHDVGYDEFAVRARNGDLVSRSDRIISIQVYGSNDDPIFASGDESVSGLIENDLTTGTIVYQSRPPADFTNTAITYALPDNLLHNELFDIVASGPEAGAVTFKNADYADADRPEAYYNRALQQANFKIGITATSAANETATQYVSIRLADINDEGPTPSVFSQPHAQYLLERITFNNTSNPTIGTIIFTPDISDAIISYDLPVGVLDNDLFESVVDPLRPNRWEIRFKDYRNRDFEHPEATNGAFDFRLIATATHATGATTTVIEDSIQLLDGYELGGTYMNGEPPGPFISSDSGGDGTDLHDHHDHDTHDDNPSPPAQDFG